MAQPRVADLRPGASVNPYTPLVAALLLVASFIGGCVHGQRGAKDACVAAAGAALAGAKGAQDTRDAAIDTLGAQTAAGRDAAVNDTRSTAHASAERIRTVVVPGDCRDVDPVVLRETGEAIDRVNAKIRSGVRQRAAGGDPAAAGDQPRAR
jgi:hypothetical protein